MVDRKTAPAQGIVIGLLVAACVVLIVAGLRFAAYVVVPLFLAFMMAVMITPLVRRLERLGMATWLAIVLVLAMAIVLMAGFLVIVSVQLTELGQKLPDYQAALAARLDKLASALARNPAEATAAEEAAFKSSEAIVQFVAQALSALLSGLVIVVFFLFLLCLMLASERSFSRTLLRVVPADSEFHRRFHDYLRQVQIQGNIRSASNFLSAVVLTGLFLIFNIDFALLWGLLAFVLGYIPNIGLILATIPAVILAFIQYGIGTALVVLTLGVILNATVDNVVIPRFISSTAELPMVIVFFSFIFWGWMFGILGAIISTQATLMVRALLAGRPETSALAQLMTTEPSGARRARDAPHDGEAPQAQAP